MASSIATSDLTIITREIITLGGNKYDSQHTQTIPFIKEVTKRIITIPTASFLTTNEDKDEGVEILNITDTLVGGPYKSSDIRYIRITNLDDENHAILQLQNERGNVSTLKLEVGSSFLYTFDNISGSSEIMQASSKVIVNNNSTVDFTSGSTTVSCDPNPYLIKGTTLEFKKDITTFYPEGSFIESIIQTGSIVDGEASGHLGGVTQFAMNNQALITGNDQNVQFKYGPSKLNKISAVASYQSGSIEDADGPGNTSVDIEIFIASV